MDEEETKVCAECLLEKPIDAFGGHHLTADGKQNICKVCMTAKLSGPRKPKKQEEDFLKVEFTIDISDYPDVLDKLEKSAYLHMRPMEHQAIAYIVEGLKRDERINME